MSDPAKGMCLKMNIADLSPVSMMPREHDNIDISAFLWDLWSQPMLQNTNNNGKTKYLGEYVI